jgi:soluble lytic murein transglycosylase
LGEQEVRLIRFREAVLARRYVAALKIFDDLLAGSVLQSGLENAAWVASLSPPVISDMGRALVYGAVGTATFLKWATFFDTVAEKAKGTPAGFYALFYGGRLYDKTGKAKTETFDRLLRAVRAAPDTDRQDDALWYYLNALLRDSPDAALTGLRTLSRNIPPLVPDNIPAFLGFFDNLSQQLLAQKKWDAYVSAVPVVTQIGDAGITSKYAYVAGRLIEEGLAKGQGSAEEFFRSAAGAGGDIYYQLSAGLRLGLTRDEAEAKLLGTTQDAQQKAVRDVQVEAVLRAYADRGFWERIYPEWLTARPWIGRETGFALAASLENTPDEALRVQGLRMAVWYGRGSTEEQVRLQYPRFFMDEIQQSAAEFTLPDRLLFALVRSESFFLREVRSRVQAQGLTQLMPATADAIAKSLRLTDYDVNDAATNVRFGAYYLADQIRRQNGSVLEALYAYNAGPNRVRTWRRTYSYPPDLFLEMIPFAETRDYGRKLLAASALYGWLYNGMDPLDVVGEMLK